MDEPDFDDDLINDYVDDYEEPPNDEEDYYMQAMAAMDQSSTSNSNHNNSSNILGQDASSQPDTPLHQAQPPETPQFSQYNSMSIHNNNETPEAMVEDDEDEEDEEDQPISSYQVRESFARRKGSKRDGYSFERYNPRTAWRNTEPTSPRGNTLQAQEWKSVAVPTKQQTKSSFPTAPDSQLLHYLGQESSLLRKQDASSFSLRPKPGRKCYPLTLGDGTRVFVNSCQPRNETDRALSSARPRVSTLGTPFATLLRRVEATQRRKDHAKGQLPRELAANHASPSHTVVDHELWVDKHAPANFAHLLSDERTNREVVRALREWDPYVFHQEPPPRPVSHRPPMVPGASPKDQTFFKKNLHKENSNPKDKRPDESNRVLLLSGPPGVGKTTLAHIVARHCGYRPLEVNGSDERSASVLKDRVVRSMESNTLNLSETEKARPACLILDEIDGADASDAVQALVEIIRAEMPTKGSKKKKAPFLRRPIIFICNNKFAPALKSLLPFCRQFNVRPPAPARLVTRLQAVLTAEKVSVSGGSPLLHTLVSVSGGDIRNCLYTLQFASAKSKEATALRGSNSLGTSSVMDITKALESSLNGEGLKDARNDMSGTITSVFRKQKQRKIPGSLLKSKSKESSSDLILDLVQSTGEGSRILDSIFLNVLNISLIDPTFDRYAAALELLSGSDIFRSHTTHAAQNNTSEVYSMQFKYLPCGAASIHLLCRVEQRQDLVFSARELVDHRFNLEANRNLTHRFVESLSPQSRSLRCASLVALEASPYILWILSAGAGSSSLDRITSSFNLLNPNEKMAFAHHVSVLRALGLTYVATDDAAKENKWSNFNHTEPQVHLDPPLARFVKFQGLGGAERNEIPDAMKGLLAQRAALETIQKNVPTKVAPSAAKPDSTATETTQKREELTANALAKENTPSQQPPPASSGVPKRALQGNVTEEPARKKKKPAVATSNFLLAQAQKVKAQKTAQKRARAGADRLCHKRHQNSHTGSGVSMKRVLRLKYVKGFTQAVRVPCRYEDLV